MRDARRDGLAGEVAIGTGGTQPLLVEVPRKCGAGAIREGVEGHDHAARRRIIGLVEHVGDAAAGFDRAFTTRNRLEQMGLEEASMEARRDDIEELIIVGNVNDEQLLQELRDLRGDLDDLDAKQYRTRNGFAQWLRQMGLEAPFDLYNY